jgi:hypothetical protein
MTERLSIALRARRSGALPTRRSSKAAKWLMDRWCLLAKACLLAAILEDRQA